jgi:hypothetical protein
MTRRDVADTCKRSNLELHATEWDGESEAVPVLQYMAALGYIGHTGQCRATASLDEIRRFHYAHALEAASAAAPVQLPGGEGI